MNFIKCIMTMTVLTLVWGCSSDSESGGGQQEQNSDFVLSEKPSWAVDWLWTDETPDWQEPKSHEYWCSMQVQIMLSDALSLLSTENDLMAVFINGTCRGVSNPNILNDKGQVVFLLNIEGDENEVGQEMQLRYYNAKCKLLFTNNILPTFEPNNLWGGKYHLVQELNVGNAKYPFSTELQVTMDQEELPFIVSVNDLVAVFVGKECRGILKYDSIAGVKGIVYSRQKGESAQLHYYSSDRKGIYTIKKAFTLNDGQQRITVKF